MSIEVVDEPVVASTPKETVEVEEGDDTDDEMPTLEAPVDAQAEEAKPKKKANRAEKKARKSMQKLGMKAVPGINRVTVKKAKNILFVIGEPDVFKSPNSDTYVIFGEAKIEDMNSQAQAQAASQFAQAAPDAADDDDDVPDLAPAAADDEEVDESGLDSDEIDTIVAQSSCSRAQAVKALRKTGNIVDAIIELTP
jgi:nascent polypeptide-associated complex subunit alpha